MFSVLEIIFRSIIFFVLLFFFTKWLRKKQLAQFQIFDYISGVVLGGIVAIHASTVDLSMIYGIVSLVVWFGITRLLESISLHSKTFREFQNKTTPTIKHGEILQQNMKKERYLYEELLADLRMKNIFDISQVEVARLENTGELSIKQKDEHNNDNLHLKKMQIPVMINGKNLIHLTDHCKHFNELISRALNKHHLTTDNILWADLHQQTFLKITHFNPNMLKDPITVDQTILQFEKLKNDLYILKRIYKNDKIDQLYNDYTNLHNQAIKKMTTHRK